MAVILCLPFPRSRPCGCCRVLCSTAALTRLSLAPDAPSAHPSIRRCPSLPNLPLVGKIVNDKKPLPTFQIRASGSDIEVLA